MVKNDKQRKSNAGRKPRYSTAMVPLNARIPPDIKAAMIAMFGGVQAAVDVLIIEALRVDEVEEKRCKIESKPS